LRLAQRNIDADLKAKLTDAHGNGGVLLSPRHSSKRVKTNFFNDIERFMNSCVGKASHSCRKQFNAGVPCGLESLVVAQGRVEPSGVEHRSQGGHPPFNGDYWFWN
jgi:hypothetical protein